MRESVESTRTPDGPMPTFVTEPEEGGPYPAVILYMDALGLREELRDMARRFGTVGYRVILPGLFYRDGNPSFDPARLALDGPDPEMMRLNRELTHARCLADTEALLAALAPAGPVATVGYCMGARHALAAAGAFPERVAAMASLHGGHQVTDRPDSAHLALRRARAECYFGFADGDPLTPPEHQATLAESCRRYGVPARFEVHPGAGHGFTFPTRHCHDKPAAERVWERLFALLARRLPRPQPSTERSSA